MHGMKAFLFFFFNDTATTEIYTLSLHDALPISLSPPLFHSHSSPPRSAKVLTPSGSHWSGNGRAVWYVYPVQGRRSEEHTSELQSRLHLVCRLLLEKKKTPKQYNSSHGPSRVSV